MQASNIDDDLRAQGFTLEGGLDHVYDANISVGGPMIARPRVVLRVGPEMGELQQAAGHHATRTGRRRSTTPGSGPSPAGGPRSSGTPGSPVGYDWNPRDRPGFNIEQLNGAPEAFNAYPNRPYLVQVRSTTTLTLPVAARGRAHAEFLARRTAVRAQRASGHLLRRLESVRAGHRLRRHPEDDAGARLAVEWPPQRVQHVQHAVGRLHDEPVVGDRRAQRQGRPDV